MAHARIGRVRFKGGGAQVVPLRLVEVGDNFRFNPDEILSAAMGQDFRELAIVAETADGELWLSSVSNAGTTLILLERAKQRIVDGAE